MTDADRIVAAYRELDQHQADFLLSYVPELATLLQKHVNDNRQPAPCAAAVYHPVGEPLLTAVGRLTLNGTPACGWCIASSDHPGGYPLDLIDPRTWSAS